MTSRDYDDVPGTYVLDSRSYRKGYHLNMFCMSLNKAKCREEFARDERAYLEKFPMTDEQRQAVMNRDYIGLLKLGANVYYTFKIVSHDRQPPQVMYGKMSVPPMSFDEFQEMIQFVTAHQIKPSINKVYSFEDGIDAINSMSDAEQFGKTIIKF